MIRNRGTQTRQARRKAVRSAAGPARPPLWGCRRWQGRLLPAEAGQGRARPPPKGRGPQSRGADGGPRLPVPHVALEPPRQVEPLLVVRLRLVDGVAVVGEAQDARGDAGGADGVDVAAPVLQGDAPVLCFVWFALAWLCFGAFGLGACEARMDISTGAKRAVAGAQVWRQHRPTGAGVRAHLGAQHESEWRLDLADVGYGGGRRKVREVLGGGVGAVASAALLRRRASAGGRFRRCPTPDLPRAVAALPSPRAAPKLRPTLNSLRAPP